MQLSDLLCLNLHDGLPPDPAHIKSIISTTERTLLVLDRDGHALTSGCCMWEVWVAACSDR